MGCGSCHTLADVGAKGTISTNLDVTKPITQIVWLALANGTCEADLGDPLCPDDLARHMPTYDEGRLTGPQIVDVSNYVDAATGSGAGIGGGCTACHDMH